MAEITYKELQEGIKLMSASDYRKAGSVLGVKVCFAPGKYRKSDEIQAEMLVALGRLPSDKNPAILAEFKRLGVWPSSDAPAETVETPPAEPAPVVVNVPPAAPAPVVTGDAGAQMAELLRKLLEGAMPKASVDTAAVQKMIDAAISKLDRPQRIEVKTPEEKEYRDLGLQHKQFPKLLKMMSAVTRQGKPVHVFMSGPAGSGKTTAVEAAAKALKLEFYFNGAVGNKYEITGFVDAMGKITRTAFKKAFKDGGVYLFDEIDGSDPNAILAVNAALANCVCDFPGDDSATVMHKTFRCVAAGNTWGLGGTSDYVGRSKMDAATLDRFVYLAWNYDEKFETSLVPTSFTGRIQALRGKAKERGLKIIISPRAAINGDALISAGFTEDEALEATILAKLSKDQREALLK